MWQRLHLLCHIWCSYDSLPGLVCELVLSDALPAATVASAGSRTACQRSSTPPAQTQHRHTNKYSKDAYDNGSHDTHATILLAATQIPSHKYHVTFFAATQTSLLGGTLTTILTEQADADKGPASKNMPEDASATSTEQYDKHSTCPRAEHYCLQSPPRASLQQAPGQSAAGSRQPQSCCSARCVNCHWSSKRLRWQFVVRVWAPQATKLCSHVLSSQHAAPPANTFARRHDLQA